MVKSVIGTVIISPRIRVLSIVMSVSACLSACPLVYLRNRAFEALVIFCTWPWLGSFLTAQNTLCTPGFVYNVVLPIIMDSMCVAWKYYVSAVLEQLVIYFQRISQVSLFDFVVVCDDSKLRTGSVSDDDMRGTAIGCWSAACGI